MKNAGILALLGVAAALAACSGSMGGGTSTLPGGPSTNAPLSQVQQPPPTATPNAANNIATVSADNTAPQPLPTVAGYGGTLTFAKPVPNPSTTPKPKQTPTPQATGPIPVGVTVTIVEPSDAPEFPLANPKSRHEDLSTGRAVAFIELLSTDDVTFPATPRFDIDVPRTVVSKYADDDFGLALYDPTAGKKYRMAVAERDVTATSPPYHPPVAGAPAPTPTATPTPALTPTPSVAPGSTPVPTPTPTARPAASAAPTLPPQRISFIPGTGTLTLHANRPVVFALYVRARPEPAASPVAKPLSKGAVPAPSPSGATLTPSPAGTSASPAAASPGATSSGPAAAASAAPSAAHS